MWSDNDDQNIDDYDSFPPETDDDEAILSFDKLRAAFANLSAEDTDAKQKNVEPIDVSDIGENDHDEFYESIIASEEERCELSPRTIFEAMLFVGNRENEPLVPEQIAELMRNVMPEELVEIVQQLNAEYDRYRTPYHIIREGDGYRMVLKPEFEPVRSRFYNKSRETKLSQAAIDVLAIVAYRQPITAEEVQQIRKLPSQGIIQQLVRRELIEIQKILREKKSVALYRTTDRFLKLFQLESLDDLPTAEEIDFR